MPRKVKKKEQSAYHTQPGETRSRQKKVKIIIQTGGHFPARGISWTDKLKYEEILSFSDW